MEISELRILCVVDAIKDRNGVGTYFQDLVSHLERKVAHVELVSPSMSDPDQHQGLSIPMFGDSTQRLYLPNIRELANTFFRVNPHIIVIPGPGLFSLAGFWLAKKMGIPVCVTHQTDYNKLINIYWHPALSRPSSAILKWINRLIFKGSSAVLTINEELVHQVKQAGIHSPVLVATPIAPEFINRPPLFHSNRINNVLFVGRLAEEKNLVNFLELARRRPDLCFNIAGDGPLRSRVLHYERQLDNMHFMGWQSRSQVIDALDQSDLLILPSSIEAFGTVALKAMARQRLVLTAPACGINQWPEVQSSLFTQQKNESLLQALSRIEKQIALSNNLHSLTVNARKSALKINQQAISQWLNILQNCAKRRSLMSKPRKSPTLSVLRRLG